MTFPGDGVAPNICRREYMAEHFYRLRAIFATLACEGANSKLVDVMLSPQFGQGFKVEVQARF